MKEFIEKLIGRLEERIFSAELYNDEFEGKTIDNLICLGDVTEIVNQLVEEYKNNSSETLPTPYQPSNPKIPNYWKEQTMSRFERVE